MAYAFIKIEEEKSRNVFWLFIYLIFSYIVAFIASYYLLKVFSLALLQLAMAVKYAMSFAIPFGLNRYEIVLILIFAFCSGCVHWILSVENLALKIISSLGAGPLNSKDRLHGQFQNIIEEVSVATGGKKVTPLVMPRLSMNAFAFCDLNGNAYIGLTEGTLARLSRYEIEAVVAHEMAYILKGDCLESTLIAVLFDRFLIREDQDEVNPRKDFFNDLPKSLLGLNGIHKDVGTFFQRSMQYFLSLLSFQSRIFIHREVKLRADAIAVKLTRDPLSLASALLKISRNRYGSRLPGGEMNIFIVNPREESLDEMSGWYANCFTVYPPIEERVRLLHDSQEMNVSDVVGNQPKVAQTVSFEPKGHEELLTIPQEFKKSHNDQILLCPYCQIALNADNYETPELYQCARCQGCLVEESALNRILSRQEVHVCENIIKMAEDLKKFVPEYEDSSVKSIYIQGLKCPRCQHPKARMARKRFEGSPVRIDRCLFCGLVWFDKDELAILKYCTDNPYPR